MFFLRSSTGIEVGETDLTIAVARNSFGKLRLVSLHRLDALMTSGSTSSRYPQETSGRCEDSG